MVWNIIVLGGYGDYPIAMINDVLTLYVSPKQRIHFCFF